MISTWKWNKPSLPPKIWWYIWNHARLVILCSGAKRKYASKFPLLPDGPVAVQWSHLLKNTAQGMSRCGGPNDNFYKKLSMPRIIFPQLNHLKTKLF